MYTYAYTDAHGYIDVHCALYTVQCSVYIVQYIVYSVYVILTGNHASGGGGEMEMKLQVPG